MSLHIRRAERQRATRYRVTVSHGDNIYKLYTIIVRNPDRRTFKTVCCAKRRIAKNLNVQVYYDATYYSCMPGFGCRTKG